MAKPEKQRKPSRPRKRDAVSAAGPARSSRKRRRRPGLSAAQARALGRGVGEDLARRMLWEFHRRPGRKAAKSIAAAKAAFDRVASAFADRLIAAKCGTSSVSGAIEAFWEGIGDVSVRATLSAAARTDTRN